MRDSSDGSLVSYQSIKELFPMLIKSCDNHETKANFSDMSPIITAIVVSTISRWSRVVQRCRFALGICYTGCRGVASLDHVDSTAKFACYQYHHAEVNTKYVVQPRPTRWSRERQDALLCSRIVFSVQHSFYISQGFLSRNNAIIISYCRTFRYVSIHDPIFSIHTIEFLRFDNYQFNKKLILSNFAFSRN